jgi:hypothetical protein
MPALPGLMSVIIWQKKEKKRKKELLILNHCNNYVKNMWLKRENPIGYRS